MQFFLIAIEHRRLRRIDLSTGLASLPFIQLDIQRPRTPSAVVT
jgi:hypothetical protein